MGVAGNHRIGGGWHVVRPGVYWLQAAVLRKTNVRAQAVDCFWRQLPFAHDLGPWKPGRADMGIRSFQGEVNAHSCPVAKAALNLDLATMGLDNGAGDRLAGDERERGREVQETLALLTSREREVLAALAEGLDNKAIAERLYISPDTARTHVVKVIAKLGVDSRLQAAIFAIRHGIGSSR